MGKERNIDSEMKKESAEAEDTREQAQYTPPMQPDFLRETIKQKPVNKKKLLRRTVITAAMAVVFGLIASTTFLVLEPVISNWLYPEEEAQEVQFPEEDVTEEMAPEDMLTDEALEEIEEFAEPAELGDEQIEEILSQVQFGLEEYQGVYKELSDLAQDINRSIVTVTGVTSNLDWFNNSYENEAVASGVIVANNGLAMLILVSGQNFRNAEDILVTFCNQKRSEAELIQRDEVTGLAILSVPLTSIEEDTMDVIDIAELGSSTGSNLLGTPVMALGSPMGSSGSVCYGMITMTGTVVDQVDSAYKLISTDIYGSRNATGVLVNLRGKIIGILDNSYNGSDRGNMLSAYGISELKRTIEKMSNNQERAYLGIHGVDVPPEAILESGMPEGTYIREIEMDSPAMAAGIQSGDVIVQIDDTEIHNYTELLNLLNGADPTDIMSVTLMRQGPDGFMEMTVDVELGSL